jgi:uncharacterized protein YjdB
MSGIRNPGRRAVQALALTLIAGAGGGCDDATGPDAGPVEKPIASVQVAPKDGAAGSVIIVGDRIQFAARALAADGSVLPSSGASWASSDASIAQVTSAGDVIALAPGYVTITATIKGKAGTISLNVVDDATQPAVVFVRVSPQGAVLEIGQTRKYTVRVFDANENELFGRSVIWSTITPSLVSVAADGTVRALASGYAEVVATVEGRSGNAGLTIPTPEPVRAVIVMPGRSAVYVNSALQLSATATGPNGGELENREFTWSSENTAIATVDANGVVRGVSKGTTRIRAVTEGVAGYAVIEVRNVPAGPVVTYGLAGTESMPVKFVEIGQTTWTDAAGQVHDAYRVVRDGWLLLNLADGTYQQSLIVETRLRNSDINRPPAATQTITDRGTLIYDFLSGGYIFRSTTTPGLEYRSQSRFAGEIVVPQSVLGSAVVRWLWIVQ